MNILYKKDGERVHFHLGRRTFTLKNKDDVRDLRNICNEILEEYALTISPDAAAWLSQPMDD